MTATDIQDLAEQFFTVHRNCTVSVSILGLHEGHFSPVAGELSDVNVVIRPDNRLEIQLVLQSPDGEQVLHAVPAVERCELSRDRLRLCCIRGIQRDVHCAVSRGSGGIPVISPRALGGE